MPDLGNDAIETYWQSKGRDLARTVAQIEAAEPWALDGDEALERALMALGAAIDEVPDGRLSALADDPDTVDAARVVLAYARAGRRFRLFSWLAEERTDGTAMAANVLAPRIHDPDAGEAARALRGSIRHLARLNLLYKVFAPERLRLILDAIREDDDDRH